jgi:hypothetical protein
MANIKITYHMMPWEIDYALQSFTQFKKSKYYLQKEDIIKIDSFLNLSNYLIDWDKSKLPKEFFIQKYKDLSNLLIDYEHNPFIYDGDELFGILDKQRMAYAADIDYYIELCPDMYFSETLLASLIESAKIIPNKYFVVTPQLYKMWDHTWDDLVASKYVDIPYDQWDKEDVFNIRWDSKQSNIDRQLISLPTSKWANWFDLYNKAFYEDMIPVQDDWKGYGPGDTYGMIISNYAKSKGVDFQQYVLEGEVIFEYPVGPLKQRDISSVYKDMIVTKNVPNQRQLFESKFQEYINIGIQHLYNKKILK